MDSKLVRSALVVAALTALPVTSAFADEPAAPAAETPVEEAPVEEAPVEEAPVAPEAAPTTIEAEPPATKPSADDVARLRQEATADADEPPSTDAPSTGGDPLAISATPARRPTRTLTVNPLALLFGSFNAELEIATSPTMTFYIGPSYAGAEVDSSSGDSLSVSAFGLQGGLRFFFEPTAPEGFWIGPQAELVVVSASGGGSDGEAAGFGLGGLLGYTWITDSGFDFSLGIGGAYRQIAAEVDGESVGVTGIGGAARVSLGFAF